MVNKNHFTICPFIHLYEQQIVWYSMYVLRFSRMEYACAPLITETVEVQNLVLKK